MVKKAMGTEQMRGKVETFLFILHYIFRCLTYVNILAIQTLKTPNKTNIPKFIYLSFMRTLFLKTI